MAYVLSSVSGNLISAASAGFAPTNSADVSAIASAYAESAASSKQDTLTFGYDSDKISAINGSALAGQGGGGLVTAIGTSNSGITSLNNSGLVDTAALHSADYSSLYVQEPLYISASGDSSYIGISGDIGGIDSATCSAIASAYAESAASSKQDTLSFGYDSDKISAINGSALAGEAQVVSAVGTETAYTPDGVSDVVTSINGNYISALSADSAFQASYDEAGRELTSLASEYEISSIASSYAESAASGKLDTTAFNSADFYTTANESGFITGLPRDITARHVSATGHVRANSTTADLYGNFDYAGMYFRSGVNRPYNIGLDNTGSNFYIATAKNGCERIYASSIQTWNSYSAKQDALTFGYDTEDRISGINGSAIAGGIDSTTCSAIASSYAESAASSKQDTLTFGYDDTKISAINGSALAGQGGGGGASIPFYGSYWDSAASATAAITADVTAVSSLAYQTYNGTTVNAYKGITDSLGNHHLSVASFISPGAEINGKNPGGIPYTMSFAPASSMWTTAGAATGIFSPLQYGTGAGMFMDNSNFKGYLKGNEWFVANTIYGYARGEVHPSRGSRVIVEHTGGGWAVLSARNSSANVTLNSTARGTAQMSVAPNQAYVQVQRGNSDSKYNSAKLDTDYLKFYNGMTTGYVDPEDTASGTAYMPAETEYMYISSIPYWNGKADSSALSSYALSADVSGTVDLVSTQSANWGGSALALSAGPGVKLEKVGNTLVASTDETVLWSGTGSTTGSTINLSESLGNFERYGIYYYIPYGECGPQYIEKRYSAGQTAFNMSTIQVANTLVRCYCDWGSMDSTSISLVSGRQAGVWYTGASVDWYDGSDRHHTITKVVGINRTAEA